MLFCTNYPGSYRLGLFLFGNSALFLDQDLVLTEEWYSFSCSRSRRRRLVGHVLVPTPVCGDSVNS